MMEVIIKLLIASLIVVTSYMIGKLTRRVVKLLFERKILKTEIDLISLILIIHPDEHGHGFSGYTTNTNALEKISELLECANGVEDWGTIVKLQSQIYFNQSGEIEHPMPNVLKTLELINTKLLKYKRVYKKIFREEFGTQG